MISYWFPAEDSLPGVAVVSAVCGAKAANSARQLQSDLASRTVPLIQTQQAALG